MKLKLKSSVTQTDIALFLEHNQVGSLEDFFYIMSMLISGKEVFFHPVVVEPAPEDTICPIDNNCNIPYCWVE